MADTSTTTSGDYEAQLGDYFALLKPRVMQLVVFTALVGMLAAPEVKEWRKKDRRKER